MSVPDVKEAPGFTFCPKCGSSLADGSCAKCGWALPTASSHTSAPRKRRRLEVLIASLVLVLIVSIGLNFLLNFDSMVQWVPSVVLLWMDDGKGDGSAELIRRLREGKLSDRHLVKLIDQRLSDPRLVLRSPFPAGHEQVMVIEQNCRMPLDSLSLQVKDWKLIVDGAEVSHSENPSDVISETKAKKKKTTKKKSRRLGDAQVAQHIILNSLDAGVHTVQLTGDLTVFRTNEAKEVVYSRAMSINRDVEISGQLADYSEPRTNAKLLELMKNACLAYSWRAGTEDDEFRSYVLSLYAASPGMPFTASVWVRVGSSGDFTKVGEFTNRGDNSVISWGDRYSLIEVPGIEEARRIQVRLTPDLSAALRNGYKEFLAVMIEWDSVSVWQRDPGWAPNPGRDPFRPPSRVRKFATTTKESSSSERDEEI